jgi:hypothetical protein
MKITPSYFYAVLGLGILLVIGIIFYSDHAHKAVSTSTSVASTTNPVNTGSAPLTGLSIYTNGQFGFSIFYPGTLKTEALFDTQYHLPSTWRVNALQNATGTPIISIVGYQTTNTNSFPRYFETEVRVGASADPHELAVCEKPGNGEASLPDMIINGVTWKAFSLEDAGMMQYLKGVSYRIIHDKTCYALEEIETGSSYRDTATNSADIPQTTLDKHYADLSSIVQSFNFARS